MEHAASIAVPGEPTACKVVQVDDVLCGEGGWKHHPGNKSFLEIVKTFEVNYLFY